ncbi:MAG: alpha/beta fold hydrolase [Anaerolineae bacterium]|nr:alpha/beta fold hydrolase [Anaerolineae bacterium]
MEESIEHIVREPEPGKRTHEIPLFFMHGAWHGAWCWRQFMDDFVARGYETHAISLPGHGSSSMNRGHINRYSFQDYVDCMAEQVAKISPTPVLIGHSMGGGIIQAYLSEHAPPAAVLLASIPVHGILPMMLRSIVRHFGAMLKTVLTLNFYYFVETPELARAQFLSPDTQIDIKALHTQLVRETFHLGTAFRLNFAPNFHADRVRSPVLVIAGGGDVLFSVEEERRTADALGAQFMVFEGQAHNLMMEPAWREVAGAIDRWLSVDLELP